MRRFLAALAAIVITAVFQAAARAHFIWAVVENGQVRFALLEDVNAAPDARFAQYVANLTTECGGKELSLGTVKDGARTAPLPSGQNVAISESKVGAKERDGESYLLVYHAKGAASLESAATATKGYVEVRARREGNTLVATVLQDEWLAPGVEVWVHGPGAEMPASAKTDLKGEARFPWTEKGAGGFVGLRAKVIETRSGEHAGKKYASVHHWATLSFPVARVTAPEVSGTDKPLTRILRESYGANHDVVENAAFNRTLFLGKLTRAQLEAHLQQRALIHNETHRILNASGSRVPYGVEQKQVLIFLFDDLIGMGSGWPTETQAHPLTRAFLQEIRDSEKNGPFFALGVQHVYYGGITNGGRMIGRKIGETLSFTPTYYAKSDGYEAYLAEVNKITDPDARKEMIRGGQAAYRYIVASMNADIFKTDTVAKADH